MEARSFRSRVRALSGLSALIAVTLTIGNSPIAHAQFMGSREHVAHSQNFIVFASSPQWAAQVAQVAEQHRSQLATYWLGEELPAWPQRCPIHVQSSPQLGAGGETRYSIGGGSAGDWSMSVSGSQERILDSVLPHEITHTIFACYFAKLGKYMPRWADEGACTTVEHESEKEKHEHYLHQFLRTGRGLAFNNMFRLKEYPSDLLPLYAQGHSAVQFLLDQGGPRKFIAFIETGMSSENWPAALREHYAYESIGEFQTLWNQWLADGSPAELLAYAPLMRQNQASAEVVSASLASDADSKFSNVAVAAPAAGQVALASHADAWSADAPTRLPSDPHSLSAMEAASGQLSWYQRRLQQVTGEDPPEYDGRPRDAQNMIATAKAQLSTNPAPPSSVADSTLLRQASSRPLRARSNGIQVLDWGNSLPVPGIQSATQQQQSVLPTMVPLYR